MSTLGRHCQNCNVVTGINEDCFNCGHPVTRHGEHGCNVERGDGVRPGGECAEALGPCGCTERTLICDCGLLVSGSPVIWVQRDYAPGYEQWWVMLDWPELVELMPNLQPRKNDNRQLVQRYCEGERGRLLAEEHARKLRGLLNRSDK